VRILRGQNLFHQYSGGGVYERHNREYSPDELWALLQIHNFEPKLATQDAYAHGLPSRLLSRTRLMRLRRDNLFAVGQKHGRSVERRPQWLYDNPNGHQIARSNRVVMGQGDRPYLGPGWSDFEYWPPGIRWTGRRASAALLPVHGERRVGFRAARTPSAVAGRVSVNGFDAGGFALAANQAQEVVLPLPDAAWEQRLRGEAHAFQVAIAVDEPAGAARDGEPTRGVPVEMIGLLD
jgi:hypothetical protein